MPFGACIAVPNEGEKTKKSRNHENAIESNTKRPPKMKKIGLESNDTFGACIVVPNDLKIFQKSLHHENPLKSNTKRTKKMKKK